MHLGKRALVSSVIGLAIAVVAACSSSSKSSPPPTCKDPSTQQASCNACVAASCAADVSAVTASCGSYLTCYAACDCSSTSCLSGCASAASSSCQSLLKASATCAACESECTNPPSMDAGKKDAGKDTGTVVKAPSCMNPTPAEAACDTCQGTMCGTQVKAAIDACNTPPDGGMSYIACYEACDCADKACAAACKFAAPMSCTSVLATSATGCTACATECN